MHGSVSAPTPEPYPDRWRTNPIADEGQASSSRSESFSNQVLSQKHALSCPQLVWKRLTPEPKHDIPSLLEIVLASSNIS